MSIPVCEVLPLPSSISTRANDSDIGSLKQSLSVRSLSLRSSRSTSSSIHLLRNKSVPAEEDANSLKATLLTKTSSISSRRSSAPCIEPADEDDKRIEDDEMNGGDDVEVNDKNEEEGMDTEENEQNDPITPPTDPSTSVVPPLNPVPFMGGPQPIEIIISFDTTGSMSYLLDEVKAKIQEIIQRLFMDIPNMKIGVLAHGDYCDEKVFYLMQKVDFTNHVDNLCQFVKDVEGTGGGDFEECYEWVLSQVRQMPWTPGTQRSLIMIGDAIPHESDYDLNKDNLDWREEADALYNDLGVRVYAVQCQNEKGADKFWKDLAIRTHGRYLKLDQFSTIVDLLMAICYREHGAEYFEAYEREVRTRTGPHFPKELDSAFDVLRGRPGPSKTEDVVPAKVFNFSKGASKNKNNIKKPKVPKAKAIRMVDEPEASGSSSGSVAKRERRSAKSVNVAARKEAKKIIKKNIEKKSKKEPVGAEGNKRVKKGSIKFVGNKKVRELVPHTKFSLNCLSWSPWKMAMCQKEPNENDSWQKRNNGIGVRDVSLFKNTSDKPAVYELAVQRARYEKKYVMYAKATSGFNGIHWDTHLLKRDGVQSEVDNIIQQGCTLFIRRALIKTVDVDGKKLSTPREFAAHLRRSYDYAWRFAKRCGTDAPAHRACYSKQGLQISTAAKKCTCVMCS